MSRPGNTGPAKDRSSGRDPAPRTPECVLFDLDGTLADTAPDLIFALNRLLASHGRRPVTFEALKPVISRGTPAMLEQVLGVGPEDPAFEARRREFLDLYGENLARETRLYPGTERILNRIETSGRRWGVVTGKLSRFTEPLLAKLGLADRAACIISGDSTARPKPHPDPLLLASERAGVAPASSLYVGDARTDIEAGNRAGMQTVAALFGYVPPGDDPRTWGADGLISRPEELAAWLP